MKILPWGNLTMIFQMILTFNFTLMRSLFLLIFCSLLFFSSYSQATSATTRAVIDGAIQPNNAKAITAAGVNGTMKAIVDYVDTKAGTPNIIVSADGKSVKIRPSDGTANASNTTPRTPHEVDPVILTTPENLMGFTVFHGNPLYQRTYNIPGPTSVNLSFLTGINEVWQMWGVVKYTEGGIAKSKPLTSTTRAVDQKLLLQFDEATHNFILRDYDCTTCLNQTYIFTLKYSKQ
jgi:hypothetical protein